MTLPKIEVIDFTEHDDGAATVVFECNEEAKKALISEGLLSLIEKAVSENNSEYDWTTEEENA